MRAVSRSGYNRRPSARPIPKPRADLGAECRNLSNPRFDHPIPCRKSIMEETHRWRHGFLGLSSMGRRCSDVSPPGDPWTSMLTVNGCW